MGFNKLLLPLEGEALVRRAATRAVEAGIDPLVVVVGHEAEAVAAALAGLPCTVVVNPAPEEGASSSLRHGLAALPPDTAGAIVMLGDMPRVSAQMIRSVREAALTPEVPLIVSRYGEVTAPPHFFSRPLFSELRDRTGDGPGRTVVRRHLHRAVVLDWPREALLDLDTVADLERGL